MPKQSEQPGELDEQDAHNIQEGISEICQVCGDNSFPVIGGSSDDPVLDTGTPAAEIAGSAIGPEEEEKETPPGAGVVAIPTEPAEPAELDITFSG